MGQTLLSPTGSQPEEGLHMQNTDQGIGSDAEVVLGVSLELLVLALCKTF